MEIGLKSINHCNEQNKIIVKVIALQSLLRVCFSSVDSYNYFLPLFTYYLLIASNYIHSTVYALG